MGQYNRASEESERQVVWGDLRACQVLLNQRFVDLCRGWGCSPNEAYAYLENSTNYTPAAWQQVQDVRTEVYSALHEKNTKRRKAGSARRAHRWV